MLPVTQGIIEGQCHTDKFIFDKKASVAGEGVRGGERLGGGGFSSGVELCRWSRGGGKNLRAMAF